MQWRGLQLHFISGFKSYICHGRQGATGRSWHSASLHCQALLLPPLHLAQRCRQCAHDIDVLPKYLSDDIKIIIESDFKESSRSTITNGLKRNGRLECKILKWPQLTFQPADKFSPRLTCATEKRKMNKTDFADSLQHGDISSTCST
jgi:hypothetical protein